MYPTPLQTLLAERLRSARGLGWDMPEPSTLAKPPVREAGGMGNFLACWQADALSNPPLPLPNKGEAQEGAAPAWFRFTCLALRSLGLARG